MRIIIAEDEQRARRGLKSLLQAVSEECEIIADAPDGVKALELIRKCKPDVVFTDIKMPYMDGITLIEKVKQDMPDIKFVIISAYEEFEYARTAISLGVTDYLVKPLIMEDIEEVMKKLEMQKEFKPQSTKPDIAAEGVHPLITKALRIIEKEYASRMSQKELAEQLGISPEYFCSLFAKEMGESFVKYMKRYRIEVAKTLLCHTGDNKEEVAFKVGYSDVKYFNKVFHEVTGKSVTEFLRERS